jgi:oligo-alginate lyase
MVYLNLSGLENTGRFFIDAIGPSGDFFNYADGGKDLYRTPPALLWLAQLYNEPLLAWYNHQLVNSFLPILEKTHTAGNHPLYNHRLFALEIVWFIPAAKPNRNILSLNTFYRGLTDIAFFRSSWEADALWVGFKTGKNSVNHAHLDCGTFVFEMKGHRWAEDLGMMSIICLVILKDFRMKVVVGTISEHPLLATTCLSLITKIRSLIVIRK